MGPTINIYPRFILLTISIPYPPPSTPAPSHPPPLFLTPNCTHTHSRFPPVSSSGQEAVNECRLNCARKDCKSVLKYEPRETSFPLILCRWVTRKGCAQNKSYSLFIFHSRAALKEDQSVTSNNIVK